MLRLLLFTLSLFFISQHVSGQDHDPKLRIAHLTGDFYIYTTYSLYENSKIPANGMYLVTDQGVALFDTPWDTTQFQPLLDSILSRHHQKVVLCFATHWHSDKTAGLEYYRQLGIPTYTTVKTDSLSKVNGKKRAEFLMTKDTIFHLGTYSFQTFFPGEGHTTDNIVIWFGKEKILYGGCLIKGVDDTDLGYMGDANPNAYATTLKRVRDTFKSPKYIVIAHNDWHNINSLKHSIEMAEKLKKENKH